MLPVSMKRRGAEFRCITFVCGQSAARLCAKRDQPGSIPSCCVYEGFGSGFECALRTNIRDMDKRRMVFTRLTLFGRSRLIAGFPRLIHEPQSAIENGMRFPLRTDKISLTAQQQTGRSPTDVAQRAKSEKFPVDHALLDATRLVAEENAHAHGPVRMGRATQLRRPHGAPQ